MEHTRLQRDSSQNLDSGAVGDGMEQPRLLKRQQMTHALRVKSAKRTATDIVPEVYPEQWPPRPESFSDLLTPLEAAQFLRLDQTKHTPRSACQTLNYWREKGQLKATKYARRLWFLKDELNAFLRRKTEGY